MDNIKLPALNLTEKDNAILEVLRKFPDDFLGPTEIGLKLGKEYSAASSYCARSLKKLVKAGLVIKGLGQYRALSEKEISNQ